MAEALIVNSGNTELWAKFLAALPSQDFSDAQLLQMSIRCLQPCYELSDKGIGATMAKMVIKSFIGPDGKETSFIIDLLRFLSFPEELARFLVSIYNLPIEVVLDELIESEDNDQMYWVFDVLTRVYGNLTASTYIELYDHALAVGNRTLADCLHEKIRETNISAKRPNYMIDAPEDLQMPEVTPFIFEMPSDEKAAFLIFASSMDDHGVRAKIGPDEDPDAVSDLVLEEYRKLPQESKEAYVRSALLQNWVINTAQNLALRRYYGPLHPQAFTDFSDVEIIRDAMFVDVSNQTIDDEDQYDLGEVDWFTGSCFRCKQKIEKRWYAVRLPLPAGGWDRCFCSWEHVRIFVKERPSEDNEEILELIDRFEQELNLSGIYDREEVPIFPILNYPDQLWASQPVRVTFEGETIQEQEEQEVVVISG